MKRHPDYEQFSERVRYYLDSATEPEPMTPAPPMKGGCSDENHVFPDTADDTRCKCGKYAFAERYAERPLPGGVWKSLTKRIKGDG